MPLRRGGGGGAAPARGRGGAGGGPGFPSRGSHGVPTPPRRARGCSGSTPGSRRTAARYRTVPAFSQRAAPGSGPPRFMRAGSAWGPWVRTPTRGSACPAARGAVAGGGKERGRVPRGGTLLSCFLAHSPEPEPAAALVFGCQGSKLRLKTQNLRFTGVCFSFEERLSCRQDRL